MNIGLFFAIWPDQSVDLLGLDVIHLLHSLLDLSLASLCGNEKYECVDLFDLLHGRFGCDWCNDDTELVQFWDGTCNGLPWVFWIPGLLQCLWQEEMNIIAGLSSLPGH